MVSSRSLAEGSPSQSQSKGIAASPSGPDRMAGGASKSLVNLPSRGLFSSTVPSSNLGRIPVYVCDRDTSPPEGQLIKTNTTNILTRALEMNMNKQKNESKDVTTKAATRSNKGKRSAVRTSDGRTPTKRANTTSASSSIRQEGSSSGFSEKMLQTMTVERLRVLLKERGLSPKGKKDELIARLKDKA